MAIIKRAKNIYSQINKEYKAIIGNLVETAEELIVDSVEEKALLSCNKKIVVNGNKQ